VVAHRLNAFFCQWVKLAERHFSFGERTCGGYVHAISSLRCIPKFDFSHCYRDTYNDYGNTLLGGIVSIALFSIITGRLLEHIFAVQMGGGRRHCCPLTTTFAASIFLGSSVLNAFRVYFV